MSAQTSALLDYQSEAIKILHDYVTARQEPKGAALVSMPTGTGKSVVIANLLANLDGDAAVKPAMVLVPWRGLATQLAEDIDTRVWEHMGVERPRGLPPVTPVRSASHFVDKAANRSHKVHVATMSMGVQIWERLGRDAAKMRELFAKFSCVIVDESHYEPAPAWSTAVRSMCLRTCLLTATPFRNDNRYFEIDENATFRLSHDAAENANVLRSPQFEALSWSGAEQGFVDALLARLNSRGADASDRVIVRCPTSVSVSAVAALLQERGETAVGFHETFKNDEHAGLFRVVPPPRSRPEARFWVHQNKLIEGFDDAAVRVLAIYQSFTNDRSRIQQIGRILRNPGQKPEQKALVLSGDDTLRQAWERYLKFDYQHRPKSVATDPVGVARLLTAQPESLYWERLFRTRFDPSCHSAWQDLRYRMSASIRIVESIPCLDDLLRSVRLDLETQDRRVLSIASPSPSTRVIVFLKVRNSPILRTGAFVETELGYIVLFWNGTHLFVTGSESGIPKSLRERTSAINAKAIQRAFPAETRISEISLANNQLGPGTIRARSLSAFDLDEVASEMADSTFAFSTAHGHLEVTGDKVTRYAGTRNGRISDSRPTEGTFEDLMMWYKEIGVAVNSETSPTRALTRYGRPVEAPVQPIAEHVLLDIDREDYVDSATGDFPEISCYGGEVDENSTFEVTINDESIRVRIYWDVNTNRFALRSADDLPYRAVAGAKQELLMEVTREKALRVAIADGLVYTNGNFWSLSASNRASPSGLLSLLEPNELLANVTSEKGAVTDENWDNTCVFGAVESSLLPDHLSADATILCTDMGHEIADFIGFDAERVVFVHAKSKSIGGTTNPSKLSGSELHVVVSQMVKNLKFLTIGNLDKPHVGTWTQDWKAGRYRPRPRLRMGRPSSTGNEYWERIDNMVQTHRTHREIWLALGASLSKSALENALADPEPSGPAVQLYALINSAWTAAHQCGIQLRIFCSP